MTIRCVNSILMAIGKFALTCFNLSYKNLIVFLINCSCSTFYLPMLSVYLCKSSWVFHSWSSPFAFFNTFGLWKESKNPLHACYRCIYTNLRNSPEFHNSYGDTFLCERICINLSHCSFCSWKFSDQIICVTEISEA